MAGPRFPKKRVGPIQLALSGILLLTIAWVVYGPSISKSLGNAGTVAKPVAKGLVIEGDDVVVPPQDANDDSDSLLRRKKKQDKGKKAKGLAIEDGDAVTAEPPVEGASSSDATPDAAKQPAGGKKKSTADSKKNKGQRPTAVATRAADSQSSSATDAGTPPPPTTPEVRKISGLMSIAERMALYNHHDRESREWLMNQAKDEEKRNNNQRTEAEEVKQKRATLQTAPSGEHGGKWLACNCHEFGYSDQRQSWCPASPPTISSAHVCIVQNVCQDNQGQFYFRGTQPSTPKYMPVSIQLANTAQLSASAVFGTGDENEKSDYPVSLNDINNPDFYDPEDTTLVLLGHTASHHITHFLEPVGSLQLAVQRYMRGRFPKGKTEKFKEAIDCAEEDLNCFSPPSHILSTMAPMEKGSWFEHVLRVALTDFDGRAYLGIIGSDEAKPKNGNKLRCWKKAVIPGAFYGLWPSTVTAGSFHHNLFLYLARLGKRGGTESKLLAPPNGEVIRLEDDGVAEGPRATSAAKAKPSSRLILIADRKSKRSVVDSDNLERIIQGVAKMVNAEVQTVQFGSKSFEEQAALAGAAGVLIGIHGADLTNMIFQKRGSVVIEMNPLFFFENRFFELSLALQHTYLAWNCGSEECAFGGERAIFSSYATSHHLNYNAEDASFESKAGKRIKWNWIGYTGMACPDCNEASCCGNISPGYYGTLRDSNVRIGEGRHKREIEIVLQDAFIHLGWLQPDEVTPMPTTEQVEEPTPKPLPPLRQPGGNGYLTRPLSKRVVRGVETPIPPLKYDDDETEAPRLRRRGQGRTAAAADQDQQPPGDDVPVENNDNPTVPATTRYLGRRKKVVTSPDDSPPMVTRPLKTRATPAEQGAESEEETRPPVRNRRRTPPTTTAEPTPAPPPTEPEEETRPPVKNRRKLPKTTTEAPEAQDQEQPTNPAAAEETDPPTPPRRRNIRVPPPTAKAPPEDD